MSRTFALFLAVALRLYAQAADKQADVDRIFSAFNTHTPGCAVGGAHNGAVVLRSGYGMADLERNVPITPNTIFISYAAGIVVTSMDGVREVSRSGFPPAATGRASGAIPISEAPLRFFVTPRKPIPRVSDIKLLDYGRARAPRPRFPLSLQTPPNSRRWQVPTANCATTPSRNSGGRRASSP